MCRMWKKSDTHWRQAKTTAQNLFGQTNGGRNNGAPHSGNAAFDDYMRQKLQEIEALRLALVEEKRAFDAFLVRLKQARDLEEFRSFLAAREASSSAQA